jgi:glyoxylase-like metal-dependent hydrolase (beta-lactamase superfamily II)
MNLYTIETGYFKLDGGAMFGVVPKLIWQKLNPADERNLCSWAMRSLLIEDADRLILIDNGIGDKQNEKFFSHYHLHGDDSLITSLKKHGFSPDDITDNIISHLHFDHVGGAIKRSEIPDTFETQFKNAQYWVSDAQWETAMHPNPREKASFLKENIFPIKESGQLRFPESEGRLFPNISIRFFHGHTQGQIIPFITYKDTTIVFAADLIPSAAHIPLPYIMSYDIQPLISMQEKDAFLKEAVIKDYILFLQHDYHNECCTLKNTEKGIRVDALFPLDAIK